MKGEKSGPARSSKRRRQKKETKVKGVCAVEKGRCPSETKERDLFFLEALPVDGLETVHASVSQVTSEEDHREKKRRRESATSEW